jgi:hypothetical protein
VVGLALVPAVSPATPTCVRDIQYRILYQQRDGSWLVPTLETVRSARQWESNMDTWVAKHQVVGREPAPAIDWSKEAVIVLSLGTQGRQTGVQVLGCRRDAELTMVDLHFELEGQWDPLGTDQHPCVVLAVPQDDLKEVRLLCNATVDGLPMGLAQGQRLGNGANRTNAAPAAAATSTAAGSGNTVLAGGPQAVTWGQVKALYRNKPATP